MRANRVIQVVGCHAEGEVGDVIVGGVLPPPGASVFEQRLAMERDHDHIRQLLICEPRGSVGLDALPCPASVARLTAAKFGVDEVEIHLQSGRQALDHGEHARAVTLASGHEAERHEGR